MSQVKEHDVFRKTYEKDLRQFVNRYLRSNKNIGTSDMIGLGVKVRGKKRGHRTKMETTPEVFIESVPGAWLKFVCRVEGKEGKASIHS